MQSHQDISIENIKTHAFYTGDAKDDFERRPVFVASSGGAGHIASIEAIIQNFKDNNLIEDSNILSYHSTFAKKPKKKTGPLVEIEVGAIIINDIPVLSAGIQKGLESLRHPKIPGFFDLQEEIKKISEDQERKGRRNYIDMLLDVFPVIGYYHAAIWNLLQRRDQTKDLKKLIDYQAATDVENYQQVYHYFYNMLNVALQLGRPYTEVISTQAMALSAMCDAVKDYNVKNKMQIKIHQYLTDLPTVGAVHFFKTLAKLNSLQRQQLYLYGVNLEKNIHDIANKFNDGDNKLFDKDKPFAKLINVSPQNNPMVRQGFKDKKLNEICVTKRVELAVQATDASDKVFLIEPNQMVASIMLGSQASNDTVGYVVQLVKKKLYDKIFVFGGKNPYIKETLNKEISNFLDDKVILLDPQNDKYIAPIMTRSNLIVIRGGGLTVMEQMAMPHNQLNQVILFHSKRNTEAQLTSGISWEDGNTNELALYLNRLKKITRTSVEEFIFELTIRTPCALDLDVDRKKEILEDTDDAIFLTLANAINRIRENKNNEEAKTFTNALDVLYKELYDDYLKQKKKGLSNEQIQKSITIGIARKTINMLGALLQQDNEDKIAIIKKYRAECGRKSEYDFFFKTIAVVVIAAAGFVLGAMVGSLVGTIGGCWSGPGAIFGVTLGSVAGSLTGAVVGLGVGTAITGITAASISGYLLFKPNKIIKDVSLVAESARTYQSFTKHNI